MVGGDFNIHHSPWGSHKNTKQGEDFVDTLSHSQLHIINDQSPTRIDPATDKLSNIYLTLISHNIKHTNWKVQHHKHNTRLSDHFPISIQIPLTDPDDNMYHSTWNLNSKTQWNKYFKTLHKKLQSLKPPENANIHAKTLSDIIYDTAIDTISLRNYINGYKPWWNNTINSLKKLTKKIHRKLEKLMMKNPDFHISMPKFHRLHNEYKSALYNKIQCIKISKKQYNEKANKILQTTSINDESTWRILKARRQSPHMITK